MEPNVDHEFMKRLSGIMSEHRLDVAKLAKLVNVTYVTAQRWSNGVVPRPKKLNDLANALRVSVLELTGRSEGREVLFSTEPTTIELKMRRIKELQHTYEQGLAAKAEIEQLKIELMDDIKNIP